MPCYNGGECGRRHRSSGSVPCWTSSIRSAGSSSSPTDPPTGPMICSTHSHVDGFGHLRQPRNLGKGAALRRGFAHATTPLVAFIDADGDLDPSLAPGLDPGHGRRRRGHRVRLETAPELGRRGVATAARLLARLPGACSSCCSSWTSTTPRPASSSTRGSMLVELLPYLEEDKFALDLELFVAARSLGYCSVRRGPRPPRARRAIRRSQSGRAAACSPTPCGSSGERRSRCTTCASQAPSDPRTGRTMPRATS